MKHIAYWATLGRNIDSELAVEESALGDGDSTGVGPRQAGNAIEQRGLPCPRSAEQDGDAWRKGDGEVKFEVSPQPLANLHGHSIGISWGRFWDRGVG